MNEFNRGHSYGIDSQQQNLSAKGTEENCVQAAPAARESGTNIVTWTPADSSTWQQVKHVLETGSPFPEQMRPLTTRAQLAGKGVLSDRDVIKREVLIVYVSGSSNVEV